MTKEKKINKILTDQNLKPEHQALLMHVIHQDADYITLELACNMLKCKLVRARRIVNELIKNNVLIRERRGLIVYTFINGDYFK